MQIGGCPSTPHMYWKTRIYVKERMCSNVQVRLMDCVSFSLQLLAPQRKPFFRPQATKLGSIVGETVVSFSVSGHVGCVVRVCAVPFCVDGGRDTRCEDVGY